MAKVLDFLLTYDAGKIAREQAGMEEEAIKIKEEEREKVKAQA